MIFEEDGIKFVQEKLTRDYNEINDEYKEYTNDKYNQIMIRKLK